MGSEPNVLAVRSIFYFVVESRLNFSLFHVRLVFDRHM